MSSFEMKFRKLIKRLKSGMIRKTELYKTLETNNTMINSNKKMHWKTLGALFLLPIAIWFDYINFYFSIIFLVWSIQGIINRQTFYLDNFSRDENPIMFWVISILWLVLSIWSLLYSEPVMAYLNA